MTSNFENDFEFESHRLKNLYKMVLAIFMRFVKKELGFSIVNLKKRKILRNDDVIITSKIENYFKFEFPTFTDLCKMVLTICMRFV